MGLRPSKGDKEYAQRPIRGKHKANSDVFFNGIPLGLRPTNRNGKTPAPYGGLQPSPGFRPASGRWFFNRADGSAKSGIRSPVNVGRPPWAAPRPLARPAQALLKPAKRPAPHFHPSLWPAAMGNSLTVAVR